MGKLKKILFAAIFFDFFLIGKHQLIAQRIYSANSVLASGNWYKLGVTKEGVYKIDVAFLNSLGINTTNLSSSSIKLFGNGGAMLDEKNSNRVDDLTENAIEVVDGGDGIFNGNDYFIFYGSSCNKWLKDSLNKRFYHKKNLYSDTVYYFLTIGTNGKRIASKNITASPTVTVNSYSERFFYENDLINFLNSGKEWFGEEFSNLPGNTLNRNFSYNLSGIDVNSPIFFSTNLASRSIAAASFFNIAINNLQAANVNAGQVSGYYLDAFATSVSKDFQVNVTNPSFNINYQFLPNNSSAQGWLNWFSINYRRSLNMNGNNQFSFRDWNSVDNNNIANFIISSSTQGTTVWDISNVTEPQKMTTNFLNNQTSFLNYCSELKEYIAFDNSNFLIPTSLGKVVNQNLHNSSVVDYLIITAPIFLTNAQRLANFHTQYYNYKVAVFTTNQIYNEFGGGVEEPTAIRDFIKMYYDKAAGNIANQPKYVLLFGAASFDYKKRVNNNTNFVPTYESNSSLEPLQTYTSDDFFAFLKDNDDFSNLTNPSTEMTVAVGRLPVTTNEEARIVVDKIIQYHSQLSFGSWRNNTVFVADDKDNNVHLNDAEFISTNAASTNNLFNQKKIYLDAFPVENGSGGNRYPQVNSSIVNQVFSGCLLFNYSGHGGYKQLAEEAVLSTNEANKFNNPNKLPLFITATCDFAPYDDPTKQSLGLYLLQNSSSGAIGLITTTRVVFAYSNKILNDNFLKFSLTKNNNQYATLGESLKKAKNFTYGVLSDVINIRKFVLLGDPAMQLAFPKYNISLTSINGNTQLNDTLKALNKYIFEGKITDENGDLKNNFNGTVFPVLYDKIQTYKTLGNDATSPVTNYTEQQNIIYKGKASVKNGLFSFAFIVPKDINYNIGNGKLSLYAHDESADANGIANSFFVGGNDNNNNKDVVPPKIQLFMNDEKFVNGGLTNENPLLIVKLFDSSGINTAGTSIGHDIVVTLDGDDKNNIVLNNFYEAEKDNFQKGSIHFKFSDLAEGNHTLKVKAWDIANNSNEATIEFNVINKQNFVIKNAFNYPNPFTSSTSFMFEHNQPGSELKVLINIYSVSGKLVHQIQQQIISDGNRVNNIFWNGKDRNSEKLAKGVYIYRIIATNSAGEKSELIQKLYLL